MTNNSPDIIIVGAGIFGVTAALELNQRGHRVALVDPGPIPHPLAESTDISKVVRMEYGADEDYMAQVERALPKFRAWNQELGAELFHETGVLFIKMRPMQPGDFEYESYHLLLKRGHTPERVSAQILREDFPAWSEKFVDGFYHAQGGWVESGNLVTKLAELAKQRGVVVRGDFRVARVIEEQNKVVGVESDKGEKILAALVVVAAGTWTPFLLPHLREFFKPSGQPVFHVKPRDTELFRAPNFCVFGADVSQTGYYGFPLHPNGVVKIANHGPGLDIHPDSPKRVVSEKQTRHFRAFLREHLPALADAPITYTRICIYCDTYDEHLWIARDPDREGLVVATGGSGHAFKFAPLLGEWIADASEGKTNSLSHKFRWRPEVRPPKGEEASRHHA